MKKYNGLIKLLTEIVKSKFALPILVIVTFIFLQFTKTPLLICLGYIGILFLLCALAIGFYYLSKKIKSPKTSPGAVISSANPLLAKFFKILDNKGMKILGDLEKSIMRLQKKAFFILESGESAPAVKVERCLFGWNDVLGGNRRFLRFLNEYQNVGLKKVSIISNDDSTIAVEKGKNSFRFRKHERKVTMKINDGRSYDYILKEENGKYNVYERLGTRPTLFAQFMKKNFEPDNIFRFPLIGTSSFLVFADNISDEKIIKKYRNFVGTMYDEIINNLGENNNRYLFSWDIIVQRNRTRFLKFLNDDLNISWTRPQIKKSKDGKTITVKKGNDSLRVDKHDNNVKIEINDGRAYNYILKEENGNINIYEDTKKAFEKWYSSFKNTRNLILVTRPYGFSIDYALKLFSSKMDSEEHRRLLSKMMDLTQQKVFIHNIRLSYLFEAAEFDRRTIDRFQQIEDEIVTRMLNEYGTELNDQDYFSILLAEKDFVQKFENCFRNTNLRFYRQIRDLTEFNRVKNLMEYIHTLLK